MPVFTGIISVLTEHLSILSSTIAPVFVALSLLFYIFGARFLTQMSNEIRTSQGPYLFITAHPDDECMFFAPTLIQLAKNNPQKVHLLCVTTGDYYKKGTIRRKEIYESCNRLGLPASNVEVLNNSAFLDGDEAWDMQVLHSKISLHLNKVNPKFIFTFDKKGISGHPNHIFLSRALRSLFAEHKSKEDTPVLFELQTVPVYRKYVSFLDIFPSVAKSEVLFVSSITELLQAQRAMFCHRSQFVWFRALYIIFSRYMMINDYTQVTL